MKKILTVLLVLAVMTASVFAVDSSLTLGYKKTTTATLEIGWFTDWKDGTSISAHDLTATEASSSYTAYLAVTDICGTTGVNVSVELPSMNTVTAIPEGSGETQTIKYTSTIGVDPSGNASLSALAAGADKIVLASGAGSNTIATMTAAGTNATKIGWIPFTFALDSNDIDNAIPNASYSATLVATIASK